MLRDPMTKSSIFIAILAVAFSIPALRAQPVAPVNYVRGRLLVKFRPQVSSVQAREVIRAHQAQDASEISQIGVHLVELARERQRTGLSPCIPEPGRSRIRRAGRNPPSGADLHSQRSPVPEPVAACQDSGIRGLVQHRRQWRHHRHRGYRSGQHAPGPGTAHCIGLERVQQQSGHSRRLRPRDDGGRGGGGGGQ